MTFLCKTTSLKARMSEADFTRCRDEYQTCCEALAANFNFEAYRRSLQSLKAKQGGLRPETESAYVEHLELTIEAYRLFVAATAPVGRHVFEWTALSCYFTCKLKPLFGQQNWSEAWVLLTKVALGSGWAGKYGSKYAGVPPVKPPFEVPTPVRVGKAVEEYEQFQVEHARDAEATDSYSLLSDNAHPNAACLMRYQSWEEKGTVTRFIDPDQDPQQESFLPFVNC
jgi:hypothetical protein